MLAVCALRLALPKGWQAVPVLRTNHLTAPSPLYCYWLRQRVEGDSPPLPLPIHRCGRESSLSPQFRAEAQGVNNLPQPPCLSCDHTDGLKNRSCSQRSQAIAYIAYIIDSRYRTSWTPPRRWWTWTWIPPPARLHASCGAAGSGSYHGPHRTTLPLHSLWGQMYHTRSVRKRMKSESDMSDMSDGTKPLSERRIQDAINTTSPSISQTSFDLVTNRLGSTWNKMTAVIPLVRPNSWKAAGFRQLPHYAETELMERRTQKISDDTDVHAYIPRHFTTNFQVILSRLHYVDSSISKAYVSNMLVWSVLVFLTHSFTRQ